MARDEAPAAIAWHQHEKGLTASISTRSDQLRCCGNPSWKFSQRASATAGLRFLIQDMCQLGAAQKITFLQ
jgi:hypothetical protein